MLFSYVLKYCLSASLVPFPLWVQQACAFSLWIFHSFSDILFISSFLSSPSCLPSSATFILMFAIPVCFRFWIFFLFSTFFLELFQLTWPLSVALSIFFYPNISCLCSKNHRHHYQFFDLVGKCLHCWSAPQSNSPDTYSPSAFHLSYFFLPSPWIYTHLFLRLALSWLFVVSKRVQFIFGGSIIC